MVENKLKQILLDKCYYIVQEKIDTYTNAMREAQEAANAESKSSAGDKYETTRALMQIEKTNNAKQLAEVMKLKQALDQINAEVVHEKAGFGSIVITSTHNYFISISAGIIDIQGQHYIALSPSSPLGKKLMELAPGDLLHFNNSSSKIQEVH